jgi:hypothetical protein
MIVFGHNSFLLHGCKPSELGLPADVDQQYRIERRQRYAHVFWIPAFGIGKIWCLRDLKSNDLYHPNATILQFLNALPLQDKTPWYTFALPLLALAFAIIAPIYIKIDDYASAKRHEAYQLERNEGLKQAIASPGANLYFEMRDADYKSAFVKIVGSDANTLKCLVVTGDYNNETEFLQAFARNKGVLDTLDIEKAKMMQLVGVDNTTKVRVNVLPDDRPRIIKEKHEFKDAFFTTVSAGFEDGNFVATLQNVGADVTLDSASVSQANLNLSPVPTKLAFGEEFILAGTYDGMEPRYNGVWTFKNIAGETASYEVSISSARIYFNKKLR